MMVYHRFLTYCDASYVLCFFFFQRDALFIAFVACFCHHGPDFREMRAPGTVYFRHLTSKMVSGKNKPERCDHRTIYKTRFFSFFSNFGSFGFRDSGGLGGD
ncbi:unnamed protein product [Laminaria digitata]